MCYGSQSDTDDSCGTFMQPCVRGKQWWELQFPRAVHPSAALYPLDPKHHCNFVPIFLYCMTEKKKFFSYTVPVVYIMNVWAGFLFQSVLSCTKWSDYFSLSSRLCLLDGSFLLLSGFSLAQLISCNGCCVWSQKVPNLDNTVGVVGRYSQDGPVFKMMWGLV